MKTYIQPSMELLFIGQNDILTQSDPFGEDIFDDQ